MSYSLRLGVYTRLGAGLLLGIAAGAPAALPQAEYVVSQKGKRFGPEAVGLRAGGRVTIVNDDDDLVHHAYVEAPESAYDSGDQEPGAKAVITFPTEDDFTVLCGIHPKMRLAVHVQQ